MGGVQPNLSHSNTVINLIFFQGWIRLNSWSIFTDNRFVAWPFHKTCLSSCIKAIASPDILPLHVQHE